MMQAHRSPYPNTVFNSCLRHHVTKTAGAHRLGVSLAAAAARAADLAAQRMGGEQKTGKKDV
jgi:hypothetical protein